MRVNLNNLTKLDFKSSEAYKILRTNIEFCGNDVKVIVITSCRPAEGKSSVSFNLAIAMAESGKKVVFIDADLRKSVIVGRYRVSKATEGLSNYLCGQRELDKVIYTASEKNLDFIFSGPVPPNPAELLGNDLFKDMIKALREEYDYVIIDTPPLGAVIDSAIIAKESDGSIIVVEANKVDYKFVQRVTEQLSKSNSRILGAILNKVDMSTKGYYGKYYGSYYGGYYGYYGDKKDDKPERK